MYRRSSQKEEKGMRRTYTPPPGYRGNSFPSERDREESTSETPLSVGGIPTQRGRTVEMRPSERREGRQAPYTYGDRFGHVGKGRAENAVPDTRYRRFVRKDTSDTKGAAEESDRMKKRIVDETEGAEKLLTDLDCDTVLAHADDHDCPPRCYGERDESFFHTDAGESDRTCERELCRDNCQDPVTPCNAPPCDTISCDGGCDRDRFEKSGGRFSPVHGELDSTPLTQSAHSYDGAHECRGRHGEKGMRHGREDMGIVARLFSEDSDLLLILLMILLSGEEGNESLVLILALLFCVR